MQFYIHVIIFFSCNLFILSIFRMIVYTQFIQSCDFSCHWFSHMIIHAWDLFFHLCDFLVYFRAFSFQDPFISTRQIFYKLFVCFHVYFLPHSRHLFPLVVLFSTYYLHDDVCFLWVHSASCWNTLALSVLTYEIHMILCACFKKNVKSVELCV